MFQSDEKTAKQFSMSKQTKQNLSKPVALIYTVLLGEKKIHITLHTFTWPVIQQHVSVSGVVHLTDRAKAAKVLSCCFAPCAPLPASTLHCAATRLGQIPSAIA